MYFSGTIFLFYRHRFHLIFYWKIACIFGVNKNFRHREKCLSVLLVIPGYFLPAAPKTPPIVVKNLSTEVRIW